MKKYFYIESVKKNDFIYNTYRNLTDESLIITSYNEDYNYYNVYCIINNSMIDIFDYIESKNKLLKKLYKKNILLLK